MESLSQILPIKHYRRRTKLRIHIVPQINLQYPEILVVKIVRTLAVQSTVHRLGRVEMGDGVEVNLREIDIMAAAIVVDLHERYEAEAWKAEREGEVEHANYFFGRVDVASDEVAAGIHLLQVDALKLEGSLWYAGVVDLRELAEVVMMERHRDGVPSGMLHQGLRLGKEPVGVEVDVDVLIGRLAQSFEDVGDEWSDHRGLSTRDVNAVDDDVVGQNLVDAFEELVGVKLTRSMTTRIRAEATTRIAPCSHLDKKVDRRGNGLCRDARPVAAVRLQFDGVSEQAMVAHLSSVALCIP